MRIKNFTNQKHKVVTGLLFSLSLTSCISGLGGSITLNPEAEDDVDYAGIYQEETNRYEVIENFETRYQINVTRLSQNFRRAVAKRHEQLFDDTQPLLDSSTNHTGFFVTLYTSGEDLTDLTDKDLWSVYLKLGDHKVKPAMIKRLRSKERWKAYFPTVSIWTEEYLVIFDKNPPASSLDKGSSELALHIANRDAKIKMTWNKQ